MLSLLKKALNRNTALKGKVKILSFSLRSILTSGPIKRSKGFCNICGLRSSFYDFGNQSEYNFCFHCGSMGRNRAIAQVILESFTKGGESLKEFNNDMKITGYLAAANGVLADYLKKNFILSEFYPGRKPGEFRKGVFNEDMTKLTFADESFDLVLSESVLEHVNDPMKSLREVNRILKRSGKYIFTVPFEALDGVSALRVSPDGTPVKSLFYHKDPLRKEGALVYNDFSPCDFVEKFLIPAGFMGKIIFIQMEKHAIYNLPVVMAEKP